MTTHVFTIPDMDCAEREARVADVVARVGAAVTWARNVARRTVRAPLLSAPSD